MRARSRDPRSTRSSAARRSISSGLIVETDGHEDHGTRTAFERDRAKDARMTLRGYRVVRFTYRQLVNDCGTVASTLTALLSANR